MFHYVAIAFATRYRSLTALISARTRHGNSFIPLCALKRIIYLAVQPLKRVSLQ